METRELITSREMCNQYIEEHPGERWQPYKDWILQLPDKRRPEDHSTCGITMCRQEVLAISPKTGQLMCAAWGSGYDGVLQFHTFQELGNLHELEVQAKKSMFGEVDTPPDETEGLTFFGLVKRYGDWLFRNSV